MIKLCSFFFVISGFLITKILIDFKLKNQHEERGNWYSIKPFYIQIAITNDFPGSFTHFWSLAVEEQFYIFWAAEPGFPFVVVSCRLFFCKRAGVFLHQSPPTNKKISRHFNKLPLQSLPLRHMLNMAWS